MTVKPEEFRKFGQILKQIDQTSLTQLLPDGHIINKTEHSAFLDQYYEYSGLHFKCIIIFYF